MRAAERQRLGVSPRDEAPRACLPKQETLGASFGFDDIDSRSFMRVSRRTLIAGCERIR
jgi:hypothetical protein